MIYAALIAAIVFVVMGVSNWITSKRLEAAQANVTACVATNKALDASCKTEIGKCTAKINEIAQADAQRKAAAAKVLAQRKADAAKAKPAIDANLKLAQDPTKLPREQECDAVFGIVNDYAKRNGR